MIGVKENVTEFDIQALVDNQLEWEKAKEYDRAFRHAKQMEKARKKNEIKD